MFNQPILEKAIDKAILNYPQLNKARLLELYHYMERAKEGDFAPETAKKKQGYHVVANTFRDQAFYLLETAFTAHFAEKSSSHLLLEAKNFASYVLDEYNLNYQPWYEAAVNFNLTALAEAKIFFGEDF